MRARNYKDELFQQWTGKDLPALWTEFAQDSAPPAAAPPATTEPPKIEPAP
jgi:hypothetical protein